MLYLQLMIGGIFLLKGLCYCFEDVSFLSAGKMAGMGSFKKKHYAMGKMKLHMVIGFVILLTSQWYKYLPADKIIGEYVILTILYLVLALVIDGKYRWPLRLKK